MVLGIPAFQLVLTHFSSSHALRSPAANELALPSPMDPKHQNLPFLGIPGSKDYIRKYCLLKASSFILSIIHWLDKYFFSTQDRENIAVLNPDEHSLSYESIVLTG